jgi:hypothetical protein
MKYILQSSLASVILIMGTLVAHAQNGASAHNLVDIAYNGIAVTVDGNLADWDDAHFVFMSQDSPFFLLLNGNPVQGVPEGPADFSAFFALKMTDDAIYVAARVRDEGIALYPAPATPNLAFDFDHISLYLSLYDIGDLPKSPHVEGPTSTNFNFRVPGHADSTFAANRHYRIGPGTDDTQSTLGPDFQLLLRAVEHNPANFNSRDWTYNGAYVDTTIAGTTAAVVLWDDEKGYNLEWRIPFTSLAGKIAKQSGPFRDFEWPVFKPEHGMVIPFDVDITDRDRPEGLNTYLRAGQYPALWRDAHNFGMRGRIVDLSKNSWDRPNSKFYIDYKPEQNITVDGNMSDWSDAMFYGNSQDHPHFLQITNNSPVQGRPTSPNDFSYFFSMKMDDDNLYVGVIVRDEGTPMIEIPATPNLAFNHDHLSVYLGLFDIGDRPGSPHLEGPTSNNFNFKVPGHADSTFAANRHYRIRPGTDDTESTLGPDFQMLIRAVEFSAESFDSEMFTYNGAYVDTTIRGTVAASALWDDEKGYFLEWKIPFTSLAGQISKRQSPFANFEWPLFQPSVGQIIVFDADVTDQDEGDRGLNRFMRLGRYPSLWRDAHNFGMRGQIIAGGIPGPVSIDFADDVTSERPSTIELSQNFPNPFNPSTSIRYALPESQHVRLSVYNMLGQEVAVLVNGVRPAGASVVTFDASSLSSGMYIYRISTPTQSVTRKMMLIK